MFVDGLAYFQACHFVNSSKPEQCANENRESIKVVGFALQHFLASTRRRFELADVKKHSSLHELRASRVVEAKINGFLQRTNGIDGSISLLDQRTTESIPGVRVFRVEL